jgi:alkylation response protein AidB-like acyl-CoA dehydrogenase
MLTHEERAELTASARALLSVSSGPDQARALLDDPLGYDTALYAEMCSLGWAAMGLPERFGGYGAEVADVAGVWSELGRHLCSTPLISSAVVAAGTLAEAPGANGFSDLIAALGTGEAIASFALCGPAGHFTQAGVGPTFESHGAGVVLSGSASFVEHATIADQLVVVAADGARELICAVVPATHPAVSVEPTPTVDHTRRLSRIEFERVELTEAAVVAQGNDAARLIEIALERGAVACGHDSFGLAEVVVENTVSYVADREQFGRPVGSFQAIKHRLADDRLMVEAARVAVQESAEALGLDLGRPSRTVAVSNAKAYATDSATDVCGDSIRSHGGIGFTWEHDAHLYLKRAMLNQAMFGTSSFHRRRIADAVLPPASSPKLAAPKS